MKHRGNEQMRNGQPNEACQTYEQVGHDASEKFGTTSSPQQYVSWHTVLFPIRTYSKRNIGMGIYIVCLARGVSR